MAKKAIRSDTAKAEPDLVGAALEHELLRPTRSRGRTEAGIGQRLRDAREKRGLSQEALSRVTRLVDPDNKGISRSVLAYYEKGRFKPGARELRLLYGALGLTPNWLVLGESDPERLREFRQRFKTDKDFYAALLGALKKLDSDSLNGVATLVFSASANLKDLEHWGAGVAQMASQLLDEAGQRHSEIKRTMRRVESKRKASPSKS